MGKEKNPYHMPRTCQSAILVLQLISTFERQIFDFLGYMWLPILGNFLNIIFVIFGLFGVHHHRTPYLFTYTIWTLVWIAYNVFIICFYLEAGDLDNKEDVLSFGAGSFSWWLTNSPGCKPVYNISISDPTAVVPPRPSSIEGCYVRFEKIEVTHAAIQLVLATLGVCLSIFLIHYINSVVTPQLEKQGVKAMYSIEYSPTRIESNQNTLEQETDLHQIENGDRHMTPRRVKRRSYRSSTRNNKSMNRQNNRQSGRSARSSGRSHKSINPVTRLIDADQNCADSSTSNDNAYGQINPGFQDSSRPNSIYNLSGPPTDAESGIRPHSALTSYSNFHGQRPQPVVTNPQGPTRGGTVQSNVTNLTQESLMNHNKNHSLDASYDDLPPPPPALTQDNDTDDSSDNTSSVATAQMPVPTLRGSTRRNEYVNIPLPKENVMQTKQKPEPQTEVGGGGQGRLSPHGSDVSSHPSQHSYANMQQQQPSPDKSYGEMDKSSGSVLTYEAETLRATNSLINNTSLYNDPYTIGGGNPSQNQWNSNQQNMYNGFNEPDYGQMGQPMPNLEKLPAPRPPERSSSQTPQKPVSNGVGARSNGYPSGNLPQQNGGYPQPAAIYPATLSQPMPGNEHQQNGGAKIPRGHAARDRASLRLKQRKEMESRSQLQHQNKPAEGNHGDANYYSYQQQQQQQQHKYSNGGPASLQPTASSSRPAAQLPHHMQNGHGPSSLPPSNNSAAADEPEDRWFMKDSMRPVGAATHGASCKCYRCQRKLTAI